ncbi:MAG: secretin N-terminal domain-containing protein, partial [Bdellovibrionota bacterium]
MVTDFNFPDADIMDIAKTLGKLTGKNFIFDKDVKGRISIISNSPITVGDAWRAFLTSLDINNFALIPSGKYIRIARQRDARDKQLRTFTGDFSPDTDALITRVFTIKYINAEEVARIFRNFVSATSRIHAHEQTNSLIVTETGANIAKLAKMLEILDIEGYDAGIDVIQVKYASASELSKLIDTLLPGTTGSGGAPRPAAGGAGGRFASRRTKEGGVINTIISDERTNTLIIHANQKGSEQVRELVSKLDQKLPVARGGKVHVYYLQFAEAKEIAETLNNLTSGVAKSSAPASGSGGTGVNPVAGSLFEGSIKVSPDKSTNSLVITASQADYETVRRVISRLDIPRDEVYAEVVIMEMSLNRDFNFSSNIALPTSNMLQLTNNTDMVAFLINPASQKGLIL